MPDLDLLRQITALQTVTVLFVVLIFQVLYHRLHREEFFKWWSWAFSAYGIMLALSWISLQLGSEWNLDRILVVWGVNVAAFVQIPLLLCGAESVRQVRAPRRISLKIMVIACVAAASGFFFLSLADFPGLTQYSIRTVPRHALLAATFAYCGWIFFRRTSRPVSPAAKVTAAACLLYALVRTVWTVQLLPGVPLWESLPLNFLDLLSTLGIALSAVFFLLEQHRKQTQRLTLYEQILPTCSVCGNVRDDTGHEHGHGNWVGLQDFVAKHSSTRLSHTFCPACLEDYKHKEGMNRIPRES